MAQIGELTGVISLEDQFSSVLDLVANKAKKSVQSIESSFATVALGASVAVAAITSVAGTIVALGIKGSELNDLDRSFERLAGSVDNAKDIMEAMNKGVANTVDSTDLLQFANRALSTGAIKTAQDFGTVTTAARALSREGFGSIESVMNTVSTALTTGRVKSLQYMTGVIDLKKAETDYAATLGKTREELSATGKLHAAQIAIFDRLNQKIVESGNLQKSFAEKITTARLAVANWFDDIAKAVAASPNVSKAFDAIGDSLIKNFGGGAQTVQETIIRWVNRFADAAAKYGPVVIEWLSSAVDWVKRLYNFVLNAWSTIPDWFKNIAKEAALAGGAIYLTQKALGSIAGNASGGFGLPELATTISGSRDAIISIKEVSLAAAGPVTAFFNRMQVLYRLDGLGAVMFGISNSIKAVVLGFAATPVGIATIFVALGAALWELGKAVKNFGDNWQKGGGTLWGFLTLKDDDTFVRRMLRSIGVLDEARKKLTNEMKDTNNPEGTVPYNRLFMGPKLPKGPSADDFGGSDSAAKKIAAANEAAIAKTEQLWDDYYQNLAKADGDSYASKVQALGKWYDKEYATVQKSVANEKYKNAQVVALDSDLYARRLALDKEFNDRITAIADDAAKSTQAAWEKEQDKIAATNDAGYMALENASREYTDFVEQQTLSATEYQIKQIDRWVDAQLDAFKGGIEQWKDYYDTINQLRLAKLNATGAVGEGTPDNPINVLSGADYEKQHQMIDGVNEKIERAARLQQEWKKALTETANMFAQLGQVSGGVIGDILRDVANVIVSWNAAADAAENYANATTKAGKAAALMQGAAAVVSATGQGSTGARIAGGALSGATLGMEVGGPIGAAIGGIVGGLVGLVRGAQAAEIAMNKTRQSFVDAAGGLTELNRRANEAGVTLDNFLKARTVEEYTAAVNELNKALERQTAIAGVLSTLGIKSADELAQASSLAYDAYLKVAKGAETGQYTVDDVNKAYINYQQTLANMGDEGAKAWLKVNGAAESVADMAAAAGYQTIDQLNEAAQKAQTLFEYMRDSGKFTASQIADAYQKALDAQDKAMGRSGKEWDKMKSRMEELNKGIEMEAPEAEMGSIEKSMREERDKLKTAMDAWPAKAEEVATTVGGAIDKASSQASDKFAEGGDEFGRRMQAGATTTAQSFSDSANKVRDSFVTAGNDASGTMEERFVKVTVFTAEKFAAMSTGIHDTLVSSVDGAANEIEGIVNAIKVNPLVVSIVWDIPDLPFRSGMNGGEKDEDVRGARELKMASGGAGYASGPMNFSTQGDEQWAFSGEGKTFADVFDGSSSGIGPVTIQVFAGRKNRSLTDIVIDDLADAPTSRDYKVIKQLAKR